LVVFLSILFLIISYWGYKKYRFILNPVTAMFMPWALILPFSNHSFYEVVDPSPRVYTILTIGLLSYLAGVTVFSENFRVVLRKNATVGKQIQDRVQTYEFNYNLLHILSAIAIVYYLYQTLLVFRYLLAGYDYSHIRSMAIMGENSELYSSYFVYLIKVFIAVPLTYLSIAVLPVEIFFGKRDRLLIIESLALMAMFVITTGGRSVILWMVMYFACTILFFRKKNGSRFKIPRKYRRLLLIGFILVFLLLLAITLSRKGRDVDLLKQVFIYYVAPLTHFDYYIDVVNESGMTGLGLASFYGLLYPVLFILRFLGFYSTYPEFVQTISYMSFQMMEKGHNIGGNIYMNAFVTIMYQPYLDGRIPGVIIILFVFGALAGRYFSKSMYQNNLKAFLLYNLMLQKILSSGVRFYFTQQSQAFCFIMAFLILRKVSRSQNEKQ